MDKTFLENFPYEIETLDPQENQELSEYFQGFTSSKEYVRIGPKKFMFQKEFSKNVSSIYNFPVRHDDTFVVTYPKSGTTFTQDLVWLLCNNFDFEKAQSVPLTTRFPFLEITAFKSLKEIYNEKEMEIAKKIIYTLSVKDIQELSSPRFIKSHLPLSLLPTSLLETTKVVYVARDPRDATVSYYYHLLHMKHITPDKSFKSFWNYFISNKIPWGPYFEHVLEAWEHRHNPNMLFLFYEDMIKDMAEAIKRVAKFLGKTVSENQINELVHHLDIENFRKNKSVNFDYMREIGMFTGDGAFIRKGKSGGWREYFDDEMRAQADEWIDKNLRDTDFKLPHC